MKRRTDEDRRRSLKLSNLAHQRDRLEHKRNLLRIDWAYVAQRRGRGDPEAAQLAEQIRGNLAEWERIGAEMMEQKTCL